MFMETNMKSNCYYIKTFIYRYPNPLYAEINDFDSYYFLNDLKINQVDPLFIYELSDPC